MDVRTSRLDRPRSVARGAMIGGVRPHCPSCATPAADDPRVWRCPACGGPLELTLPAPDPATLAGGGMWRYREWLATGQPVSLGEPVTPLVELQMGDRQVTAKVEGAMPTGSFKDRGAAALVSWLSGHGVEHVVDDSSGNAGAALAAYCARAGIGCDLLVPDDAPAAKLAQIEAYGARAIRVHGPRAEASAAAERAAEAGDVYASHAWSPLYLAGTRTFAYELWEQMGGEVPDVVVAAVGGGALLLGMHDGFAALRDAGLTERVPRLVAAQAAACAPLVEGFSRGLTSPPRIEPGQTRADGIRIAAPVRGARILAALAETGGTAVAVSEQAAEAAWTHSAREGLMVERTSAVAFAALKLAGVAEPGERVVVAATGNGLKTPTP